MAYFSLFLNFKKDYSKITLEGKICGHSLTKSHFLDYNIYTFKNTVSRGKTSV